MQFCEPVFINQSDLISNAMQCEAIRHSTVHYILIQLSTALHNTIEYYITQYSTINHNLTYTVEYSTTHHNTTQHNVIQYNMIHHDTLPRIITIS